MKLHYSQTINCSLSFTSSVLIPYEITLLSNFKVLSFKIVAVLIPYEITLLSNCVFYFSRLAYVLIPYEITLLSN